MTNPKTENMSTPQFPTLAHFHTSSTTENKTVWLFARPLRSSFFDWLSRGDLILCHWGLLVGDLSDTEMAVALNGEYWTGLNRWYAAGDLGRMYELGRTTDGKNPVLITCPVTGLTVRHSWPSFVYQFVSTTNLLYEEIDRIATEIVISRPDYRLFENNCQNFVRYLIEAISPDAKIRQLVETTHKQLSNGEESVKISIPGAYPKFSDSTVCNAASVASARSVFLGKSPDQLTDSSSAEGEVSPILPRALPTYEKMFTDGTTWSSEDSDKKTSTLSANEAPYTIDSALFQSDHLLPYSIELSKDAHQAHQIGLGGFSVVYLVFPTHDMKIANTGLDAMAIPKIKREKWREVSTLYSSPSTSNFLIPVARKYIRKMGFRVQESDINNELRALGKLCVADQGKFLVRVFNYERSASREFVPADLDVCSIDMELCSRNLKEEITGQESTLQDLLREIGLTGSNPNLSMQLSAKIKQIVDILYEVLEGLEFIHSMNEVHRDLKPENVLFSYADQRWKIADFGCTAEGTGKEMRYTEARRGTDVYRSPELLVGGVYNNKTDIWALGCIVFEFCTKGPPFRSDYETIDWRYSAKRTGKTVFEPSFEWPVCPEATKAREILNRFVDQTLQLGWDDRPSCTELVNFLREIDE